MSSVLIHEETPLLGDRRRNGVVREMENELRSSTEAETAKPGRIFTLTRIVMAASLVVVTGIVFSIIAGKNNFSFTNSRKKSMVEACMKRAEISDNAAGNSNAKEMPVSKK